MIRIFYIFTLFLFLLSTAKSQDQEELNIIAHNFPPFQYPENGRVIGPMVDIMNLMCEISFLRCNITSKMFIDAIPLAEQGIADIIFTVSDTAERRNALYLFDPVILTSYAAFTLSKSTWFYNSVRDLDNKTIGAYGPSTTFSVAKAYADKASNATVIMQANTLESFQQLIIGAYGPDGIVVSNKDVALALLKSKSMIGPRYAGDLEPIVFTIGMSKLSKKAHLLDKLKNALYKLQVSGEVKRILNKYGIKEAPVVLRSKDK
jgi:ABC-type amino acid transport substrate-binding protein